ncbi:MAG: peptidoglycan DD-metalloendopeptidase family protein [Gammaproteobacteria bacterium]|jgi:murein DD-endopeptidase MepM/ murein hydrolase activator NlpD|nr:peptidoglycan DD-metalloendopeptidase family protein [Gammaproteobacteria bacterium]MBT4605644.1 peptidoglycan DD-metalloendopeptidase family protein [Thiotrichales bacterium]MBT3471368.1 peptidoglycan DD-metalloendopeptidase family protein [Gammaproteobacteria bacterium]MBT3966547.1 peptidoglycan DD-metalloendopeptidase family protein [Gammaproteobacteria bacterium]MBT4079057.1 peptidoglycan DD-metalloendopeptidase family protein [Gammaproteobacteria bacterium]
MFRSRPPKPLRTHVRRVAALTTVLTVAAGCTPQNPAAVKSTIAIINKTTALKPAVEQMIQLRRKPPAAAKLVKRVPKAPAIAQQKWVVKSGRISRTFSQSARKVGIPANHIQHLESLFAERINFRRDIHKGDQFTVILQPGRDGTLKGGTLLAAEMSNRGKTVRMIRHTDHRGVTRYYDGRGEPLGADFLRHPLKNPKVSSHFTLRRYHPILKTYRPHRGTDYKAKKGTPVIATADGVVAKREYQSGYGNVVFLEHHGGQYTTVYGHFSRFAKWLKPGVRVRQGSVIGYVGSTGLSTGPHLHYEFREGEEYRDAMKVALPQKRTISAKERRHFYQSTMALRRTLLSQKSGNQLASAK